MKSKGFPLNPPRVNLFAGGSTATKVCADPLGKLKMAVNHFGIAALPFHIAGQQRRVRARYLGNGRVGGFTCLVEYVLKSNQNYEHL